MVNERNSIPYVLADNGQRKPTETEKMKQDKEKRKQSSNQKRNRYCCSPSVGRVSFVTSSGVTFALAIFYNELLKYTTSKYTLVVVENTK